VDAFKIQCAFTPKLDVIARVLGKNLLKISSRDSASMHLKLLENAFVPKLNLKYFMH